MSPLSICATISRMVTVRLKTPSRKLMHTRELHLFPRNCFQGILNTRESTAPKNRAARVARKPSGAYQVIATIMEGSIATSQPPDVAPLRQGSIKPHPNWRMEPNPVEAALLPDQEV
jgi:hypothetical protein